MPEPETYGVGLFEKMDKDKSGKIERDELQSCINDMMLKHQNDFIVKHKQYDDLFDK